MEFLIIIAGVFLIIVLFQAFRREVEVRHAAAVTAEWRAHGCRIRAEAVASDFYGSEPRNSYSNVGRQFGALGVVDDALVLISRDRRRYLVVKGDEIRWFGQRRITVYNNHFRRETALMVHYEQDGWWHVAAFVPQEAEPVMRALAEISGLERGRAFGNREDYGPIKALRMHQDVYGQWHPDDMDIAHAAPEDSEMTLPQLHLGDSVYLAPDRLLYNRRDGIRLEWLRRVDLYEKGGLGRLNPFCEDLMRIEYRVDDRHHVVGFLLRHDENWARELERRLGIPGHVHYGRGKNKAG